MEVRNRFKGVDLIDRVPDEIWMEVRDIVHETESNIVKFKNLKKLKKKEMQKSKMAV